VGYVRLIGTHEQYAAIDAQPICEAGNGHQTDRTNADYRAALKEIESLMSAKGSMPEGDRLEVA
jgi:hypothetical protein